MVGIDIVYIPEFTKRLARFPLETLFQENELRENRRTESLAGIFAAKEAFFKAIGEKKDWQDVWIEKNEKGKPRIFSYLVSSQQKTDMSISYAGDYAIAIVTIENT